MCSYSQAQVTAHKRAVYSSEVSPGDVGVLLMYVVDKKISFKENYDQHSNADQYTYTCYTVL